MGVDLPQSVPLCLLLAAAGGVVEVLATAVLARQDERAKEGFVITKWRYRGALAMNTILQVSASVLGNLFAPWFGPVSLVGPMFLSAQLVANMIIFGVILGLEAFTKDMKTGTYVIVVAALLLPEVGPQAQDDQDVVALVGTGPSLVWTGVMLFAMMTSSVLLNGWDIKALPEKYRIVLILIARSTSFAVNLTVSRVMALSPNIAYLSVSIVLKIISGAVMTHAIVVQSTAVSQAVYVPLNACTLIGVNAITGIIVWEDYKAIGSWLGYSCVFVLLLLGSYLLLGDFELFGADNAAYGMAGTWKAMKDWNGRKFQHIRRASMGAMQFLGYNSQHGRDLSGCPELVMAQSKLEQDARAAAEGELGTESEAEVDIIGEDGEREGENGMAAAPAIAATAEEDEPEGGGRTKTLIRRSTRSDPASRHGSALSAMSENTQTAANGSPKRSSMRNSNNSAPSPPLRHLNSALTSSSTTEKSVAEQRHRQAWASVYGLHDPVHREGHHYRERNIFAIDHYYNRNGECVRVEHHGGSGHGGGGAEGSGHGSSGHSGGSTILPSLHLPHLPHIPNLSHVTRHHIHVPSVLRRPSRPKMDDHRSNSAPAVPAVPAVPPVSASSMASGVMSGSGTPKIVNNAGGGRYGHGGLGGSLPPKIPTQEAAASPSAAADAEVFRNSAPPSGFPPLHPLSERRDAEGDDGGRGARSPPPGQIQGKIKLNSSCPSTPSASIAAARVADGEGVPPALLSSSLFDSRAIILSRSADDAESGGGSLLGDHHRSAMEEAGVGVEAVEVTPFATVRTDSDGKAVSAADKAAAEVIRGRSDTAQTVSTAGTSLISLGGQAEAAKEGRAEVSSSSSPSWDDNDLEGGQTAAAAGALASAPSPVSAESAFVDELNTTVEDSLPEGGNNTGDDDEASGVVTAGEETKASSDFRRRISNKAWLLIALVSATIVSASSVIVMVLYRAPDEVLSPGAATRAPPPPDAEERVRLGYEAIKAASLTGGGGAMQEEGEEWWPETSSGLQALLDAASPEESDSIPPQFRAAGFLLFDEAAAPLAADPSEDAWFLQRYALRAFWEATGGRRGTWYVEWNWTTPSSTGGGGGGGVCDFYGVRCDPTQSYVTELLLSSNGLATSSEGGGGMVPDEIVHLIELTNLHLDGNPGLSGPVPSRSLRSLTKLRSATFRGCGLAGAIPPELFEVGDDTGEEKASSGTGEGQRSSLKFLSLEGNEDLEGPVPMGACDASEPDVAADASPVVVVNCKKHPCPCCKGPHCE